MRHLAHNRFGIVREVVGRDPDDDADQQSDRGSAPDAPGEALEQQRRAGGQSEEDGRRHICRRIKRSRRVAVLSDARRGDADDRRQKAEDRVAEHHRRVRERPARQRLRDDQRGGHRRHVGVEQVGAHAGHVADVVADVVRDDGGIARVVLRDAQLDLTRQVRRHVGRFGENAAARFGEQGQRAGAERKAQQDARVTREHQHGRHAEQRAAHDQQAHHRAAAEADEERGLQPLLRALGRAAVGKRRNQNADFAGDCRQDGARDIGDGHRNVGNGVSLPDRRRQEEQNQNGGNGGEFGKNLVFTPHKRVRPLLDERGHLLNLRVHGFLLLHPQVKIGRESERQNHGQKGETVEEGKMTFHAEITKTFPLIKCVHKQKGPIPSQTYCAAQKQGRLRSEPPLPVNRF